MINLVGEGGKLPAGSVFLDCKDFDIGEILPFRTYMKVESAGGGAPKRYILIGDGTLGKDNVGDNDNDDDKDKPKYSGINLLVENHNLVITSDQDTVVSLYGISGQLYRHLTVHAGVNVYRGLNSGVYIALGKKFVIRR